MVLVAAHRCRGEKMELVNINVGILGHVDSGKTSLVKALSTVLSTAALDKHPQVQGTLYAVPDAPLLVEARE